MALILCNDTFIGNADLTLGYIDTVDRVLFNSSAFEISL